MSDVKPYDAVLLQSFGGPEGPDDVMPFLENVTRGRGIPRERLEDVAQHYLHFGGKSPINDQNKELLAALRAEFDARGLGDLPLLWGNRNWEPYVTDVLRAAHEDGARKVLTVFTSAYSSYSSCRQYREDLGKALGVLAEEGRSLEVDKIRHYFNHPAFVDVNAAAVADAVERLPEDARASARVVFVTHSIPDAMNDVSGPPAAGGGAYVRQHLDVAGEVARRASERLGRELAWDLAYCSRSGPPSQPWLEPDVNDHLRALHADGVPGVVVAPIGFVSDHMEVKFDLDTEAAETAGEIGLPFARAATVGATSQFVAGLVDLVEERAAQARGEEPERPVAGGLPPSHTVCPVDCCRNLRASVPAATGEDWRAPVPAGS
ncbi:ferrochelatase [Kineococcus endophyticus]|uniref:Coproporphyrin III ferrochelatase n=1 Tax=Kineococcus endophyticus TaxID=1181883 RepID=A0ABV3P5K8_9ACTN